MELILQRWSWLATFAAAILSAFFIARTVNTLAATAIAPAPGISATGDRPRTSAAAHTELDGDRFAKAFDLPMPKPIDISTDPGTIERERIAAAAKPGWTSEAVRSPLHGLLVGTALATPERWSLCQINNTDANETLVYALGDTFLEAKIYKIEKAKVFIDNAGKNEFIDANPPGGPNVGVVPVPVASNDGVKQTSENQYVISKKEIDNALANLSDLATKARIVPSFKNGAPNGFKLFSIVPDSLYSKIGVQNGDVIHKINGYEMNSPDKALEIYQKLRDSTRIDIELERRGETVRKQYSIE